MGELKPCPFCGKDVRMKYSSSSDMFEVYHKYPTPCPIAEPIQIDRTREIASLADAYRAWNRRAE